MTDKAKALKKAAWTGDKNPRWNGGVSPYPNHAEFKRQRIKVFQRAKGKCEICKKRNCFVAHHIDEDKSNHSLSNLIGVCQACHHSLHTGENAKKRTSKYLRLYGYTLMEISDITGYPRGYITLAFLRHNQHESEILAVLKEKTGASIPPRTRQVS